MLSGKETQATLYKTNGMVIMNNPGESSCLRKIILTGALSCLLVTAAGCRSFYMQKLPIEVQVVDAVSRDPIPDAAVELWWRTGFGGITWGKPVVCATDSNGVARFTSENIPALDDLGGELNGGKLKMVMVEGWSVNAIGHQNLVIRPLSNKTINMLEVLPLE